jgi:hypothetical protein
MPATAFTVNPAWRRLNAEVRRKHAEVRRRNTMLEAASLEQPISESVVTEYQLRQGKLRERIEHLHNDLEALKAQRKAAPHHVSVKDLPEEFRFTRLRSERKHFLDTIKMISYRAETSMVSVVREKMARTEDARSLLRQIFDTEVDLVPNLPEKTLTVKLHHLTQRAHDQVIRHLCDELNATESLFPGTDLRLIYKLGSS